MSSDTIFNITNKDYLVLLPVHSDEAIDCVITTVPTSLSVADQYDVFSKVELCSAKPGSNNSYFQQSLMIF